MVGTDREWRRPFVAQPAAEVVSSHVADLSQLAPDDVPQWLTALRVPTGWRTGRLESGKHQPWRIAVCGPRSGGGWDGCETIAVFGFTGFPPPDVIQRNSEWILRNLKADAVATVALATPPVTGVCAARSTGYFRTAGLEIWAQHSFYVVGSDEPCQGRLIQQCVFVESSRETALKNDIAHLSDALHNRFIAAVNSRGS
jgi:hypothetical protein